jgi:poly [ADP-ribose] polymerase
MYGEIEKFVMNTQGSTHYYKLELLEVFEVKQEGKKEMFDKYNEKIGNRTLLVHGSSVCNWTSILLNDLLINPQSVNKNVVISGKMFSNGIYFADSISKSFGYCRTEISNNIACLALTEVALGKIGKRVNADYYITPESLKKEKCDSIQGIGKFTPSSISKVNDCSIPNGKLVESKQANSLMYNEYIVYNSKQQLIKYLILVKNNK